jgi:methionyl-tRNA formyltransferase
MYNKVLVITDNLYMAQQFERVLLNVNNQKLDWKFAISPFSNEIEFKKVLNSLITVFNLKDEMVIDEIISNYELVFSIHSKQIFPKKLVNAVKCINVHPGYNPINRGWYPQVFAIINNLPIGATIHEIDEELDHGNIIARAFVTKNSFDTSESLYNKIVLKEIELLEANINSILKNTYTTMKPEQEGDLFLKKDFNALCKLNLEEVLTTETLLNKLRALTHGGFKNAYYIDKETGKKVFVKIDLEFEE